LHPNPVNRIREQVVITIEFTIFISGGFCEQVKVQKICIDLLAWPCNFSLWNYSLKEKHPMKRIRIGLLPLIAGLMLYSCDWHETRTVNGTGDVESMEVSVPEFRGVSITGECNVDLVIGETQHVELSAQPEILEVMTYEVKDKILQIGFKKGTQVNSTREISADVVIPEASYVAVTGAGMFELEGDKQDYLHIYITGAGDVKAFDMEVDDCLIQITGTGNCEVHVTNSLDVQVSGVGNVFYKGDPSISSDISGVGNITAVPD
jgi:hypothetical protein